MRQRLFICVLFPILLLVSQLATSLHAIEHLQPIAVGCDEISDGGASEAQTESCSLYHIHVNLHAPAPDAVAWHGIEPTIDSTMVLPQVSPVFEPHSPHFARGPPSVS